MEAIGFFRSCTTSDDISSLKRCSSASSTFFFSSDRCCARSRSRLRTRASSSRCSTGLLSRSSASVSRLARRASWSATPVTRITGRYAVAACAFSARATSKPSAPGIRTSTSARSGGSLSACSMAASPRANSSNRYPSPRNMTSSARRATSSSSTMKRVVAPRLTTVSCSSAFMLSLCVLGVTRYEPQATHQPTSPRRLACPRGAGDRYSR